MFFFCFLFFFLQAEDGIRVLVRSRGLGDVYKRQSSRSCRSWSQSESAGPWNRSAISSQRLHWVGPVGTSRALGLPETVIVISSPFWARRTRSDAVSYKHLKLPTSDLGQISVVAVTLKKKTE